MVATGTSVRPRNSDMRKEIEEEHFKRAQNNNGQPTGILLVKTSRVIVVYE